MRMGFHHHYLYVCGRTSVCYNTAVTNHHGIITVTKVTPPIILHVATCSNNRTNNTCEKCTQLIDLVIYYVCHTLSIEFTQLLSWRVLPLDSPNQMDNYIQLLIQIFMSITNCLYLTVSILTSKAQYNRYLIHCIKYNLYSLNKSKLGLRELGAG